MKKAVVSVTNDLSTDQRVDKVCKTLMKCGFEVELVGRQRIDSQALSDRNYSTKRFRLLFEKNVFFYAEFNLRLFFYLLANKQDLLIANDLDTLLPNYLISKIKRIPLVYDSHEYFCGVPELESNAFARNFWLKIERFIFPKLKHIFTVNDSIAELYRNQYNVELKVVRNIPLRQENINIKSRKELMLPVDKKILLLQGAGINVDRGVEELIEAMQWVDNAVLLIIGGGDVFDLLKQKAEALSLTDKIRFIKKLPYADLMQYTANADLGLTLDRDSNLNYRFSLPNKLFDYIHAGIAVLSSDLIEIRKIIEQYEIGEIIKDHQPETIANHINKLLTDDEKRLKYAANTKIAAAELCWENEEKELMKVYKLYS
ncbi:MAG: glycosyltransferase [Bacteroidetes bacterium]|nr:glycosyltransferase [Bacteroidota bacterium]